MKNKITLSINPTYLCNFRCHFCYLTPEQLSDKSHATLDQIRARIVEIVQAGFEIDHVDLYGGEIALLSEDYLNELDLLLQNYGDPTINIITNLSKIHPYFLEDHIDLSVSFDFDAREKSDIVLNNILKLPKSISILMLASKKLIEMDVDRMINTFNSIHNIQSVEIKPYSSNQANNLQVTNAEFEQFIFKWLNTSIKKRFDFTNKKLIDQAKLKTNNAFSDDHIYITPNGKFAVLEFDTNNNEYFLELNAFNDYIDWTKIEKKRVNDNPFCQNCDFLGHCLTEHYRNVTDHSDSCNGFKNLLTKA